MKKTLLLITLLSPMFLFGCTSNNDSEVKNIEVDTTEEITDSELDYELDYDEYFEPGYSDEVIDPDTAKKYVNEAKDVLSLNYLTNLDVDSARELAKFKGETLSLQGIRTIDSDALRALLDYNGYLVLGLDKFDINTANEFLNFKGDSLGLNNIRRSDLDDSVLSTIELYNFKLYAIEDFDQINEEVQKILEEAGEL